uniref:Uncharacterized protein n=1 Tax=Arundo donax TaxID=35708 RepID=A0A0A9GED6_ARUDO
MMIGRRTTLVSPTWAMWPKGLGRRSWLIAHHPRKARVWSTMLSAYLRVCLKGV